MALVNYKTAICGILLTIILSSCGTVTTVSYDSEGNVTKVEGTSGTEVQTHQRAKVDFKAEDTKRIAAQSEAIKGLAANIPEGATVTEAILTNIILGGQIADLQPQEYGEKAPTSWVDLSGKVSGDVLKGFGIYQAFSFGKAALSEAGDVVSGDKVEGDLDKSQETVVNNEAEAVDSGEELTDSGDSSTVGDTYSDTSEGGITND